MSAPLYERLINYHNQNRISFAMPGHKNGRGIKSELINYDVTELEATENLHHPREFVTEAKRLLSKLYGSEESYILTCGSTAGIQAMIASCVKRGGTLLAAADCHMSVINACAILGIKLKFIPREIDGDFLIAKRLFGIEEYMDGADAVIITSPTYYGLCSDIGEIAKSCHKRGIPLLVDEAHGAHFAADSRFPDNAVSLGADLAVNSAHKTLNALTGAAYLHFKSDIVNKDRLEKALTMFQTSSPSYVIAASADLAREETERGGWSEAIDRCEKFKNRIKDNTEIKFLENDDITRLVLNLSAYDTTGFEINSRLSQEFGIDIEMADLINLVLIATPSNTDEDFDRLYDAVLKIVTGLNKMSEPLKINMPPVFLETVCPSDAFFEETEEVVLADGAGKISAVTVTPYPPGIPVLYMGAVITREQVEYIEYIISAGAEVNGIKDGRIEVLKSEEDI